MTYLRTLGGLLADVATAAGDLAQAGARAAGYAIRGGLEFLDREAMFAARALKKRTGKAAHTPR